MSHTGSTVALPMSLPALVEQLATALVASRLHDASHVSVVKPLTAAAALIDLVRQETGLESFAIIATDETLSFQGRAPMPASLSGARLVEVLRHWKAAGMRFLTSVTADELGTLLELLVRPGPDSPRDLAELAGKAARAGCRRVGLVASAVTADRSTAQSSGARTGIAHIGEGVAEAFTGVAAGSALDLGLVTRSVESLLASIDASARADGEGLDLSRQDADDPLAVLHAIRVAGFAMIAARAMTKDVGLVLRIGSAALLHDVGRMLLPLELLQPNRRLEEADEQLIEQHPALGAEFLMSHAEVDPMAVAVAFGHHVTTGTDGYPSTCHEHATSRFTQLVRIADVFEALTARRSHRPPLTPTHAYRSIVARRDAFDQGLLRRFVEANGIHPLGALVQLDTGETARVVRQSSDLESPVVRVVTPGGTGAPRGGLVDLSRMRGARARIVSTPAAG